MTYFNINPFLLDLNNFLLKYEGKEGDEIKFFKSLDAFENEYPEIIERLKKDNSTNGKNAIEFIYKYNKKLFYYVYHMYKIKPWYYRRLEDSMKNKEIK